MRRAYFYRKEKSAINLQGGHIMGISKIPCCIIRGGTSKGIFIEAKHLPESQAQKDKLLLALFGSPDIRQIDGLGGADPLTSKLAVVSKSTRDDADVEFDAAEIYIDKPVVNYGIMCGNTASGVGYFAIENGLVKAVSPNTVIRIYCQSNNKIIIATIPVKNGEPIIEGDYSINGVPGTGTATKLNFIDPSGGVTGNLLPTGLPVDSIEINSKPVQFSLVDSGTLYAFIDASDLGIVGNEQADILDANTQLLENVNHIREAIAEYTNNINPKLSLAAARIKIALISKPRKYTSIQGSPVNANEIDIVSRIVNPLKIHKAYAVSGAICLASAAAVPDTIPNKIYALTESPASLNIGHPSGIIDVNITFEKNNKNVNIIAGEVKRTARILMSGTAHIKM